MTFTPDQAKAARELLGWSQTELANLAFLNSRTIAQFEGSERRLPYFDLKQITAILEAAGAELMAEHGAVGVRLRNPR
jgi:transcriptional regulator with XRE-family HTH domain